MSNATTALLRRRWWQFSLRTMFAVVTLAAVVSYWLARPTILAHRFCHAIESKDYEQAEGMFIKSDPPMRLFEPNEPDPFAMAELLPLTIQNVIDRQRIIRVTVQVEDIGGWDLVTVIFNWRGGKITMRMS